MLIDQTQVRRDLDNATDRLGWPAALAHLAAKAKTEGNRELASTLAILADVMDGDKAAIQTLLDESQGKVDRPEADVWQAPFGETD